MNTLSFDTGSAILTVGLSANDTYLESRRSAGLRHAEQLMPLVDSLLEEAGIAPRSLDLVVCASGPGSFTGLRIGMATAKGIALGSAADIVSIPTLDALGHSARFFDGVVVPVIDARKKRYYCSGYANGERITDYLDVSKDDIIAYADTCNRALICGPDAGHFEAHHRRANNLLVDTHFPLSPGYALVELGKIQFQNHGSDAPDAGPLYLRRSEAEIGIRRKVSNERA